MKVTAAVVATAQLLAVAYAQNPTTPFNPHPPTSSPSQPQPSNPSNPSNPNNPSQPSRPPNSGWPTAPPRTTTQPSWGGGGGGGWTPPGGGGGGTWTPPGGGGGWNPPPTWTPLPGGGGGGSWPTAPPSNNAPGWSSGTFALRINAPDWQDAHGRYLEVHGDPDGAYNWVALAPEGAGQYPNIFDFVNYFQGKSYGNIHYRVPGGQGELFAGFLQTLIDRRVSPRPLFMTNPANRNGFHWLDDSWMGQDGEIRRDPDDISRDPRADPNKVGDNWLLCRVFIRRWQQPGSSEEWALHWTDNDNFDPTSCWKVGLTFEWRQPWSSTSLSSQANKKVDAPHNDEK